MEVEILLVNNYLQFIHNYPKAMVEALPSKGQ
jgi:hypothetical protein